MSEPKEFLWRLTAHAQDAPLELEPGDWLKENLQTSDYVQVIGEALINIGTSFLLSLINGDVEINSHDEGTDSTELNDEIGFSFE